MYQRISTRVAVLAINALLAAFAHAAQNGAIRSCYEIAPLPQTPPPATTELVVAIDQTTLLDDNLKNLVVSTVQHLRRPGVEFSVVRFSAYTQGYYSQVLVSGQLDSELTQNERDDTSKPLLAKFDNCMRHQLPFADKLINDALQTSFAGTSGALAKSDVLASLKDISKLVQTSVAKRKLVLVVSDMLENSSITSFYASQNVRLVDPPKELKLVADAQLFGDFGDAKIYVIGAGLLPDSVKSTHHSYRDPKTMQALFNFWDQYFQQSHAQLVEFGQPSLLRPVD